MTEGEVRFRVLTVCTGNICRSPAGERLIRFADGHGATDTVNMIFSNAATPLSA